MLRFTLSSKKRRRHQASRLSPFGSTLLSFVGIAEASGALSGSTLPDAEAFFVGGAFIGAVPGGGVAGTFWLSGTELPCEDPGGSLGGLLKGTSEGGPRDFAPGVEVLFPESGALGGALGGLLTGVAGTAEFPEGSVGDSASGAPLEAVLMALESGGSAPALGGVLLCIPQEPGSAFPD